MEEFRDIPGYEGIYQVSLCGKVKSLARTVELWPGKFREFSTRLLTPYEKKKGSGYFYVKLNSKGKEQSRSINALIDTIWHGKEPREKREFPGITKRGSRWNAYGHNYKPVFLGSFVTKEKALKAKMEFEESKCRA